MNGLLDRLIRWLNGGRSADDMAYAPFGDDERDIDFGSEMHQREHAKEGVRCPSCDGPPGSSPMAECTDPFHNEPVPGGEGTMGVTLRPQTANNPYAAGGTHSYYECGTCGDQTLILESPVGKSEWILTCGNGHPWILLAHESVRIEIPVSDLQKSA